jgi:hypothetical protein
VWRCLDRGLLLGRGLHPSLQQLLPRVRLDLCLQGQRVRESRIPRNVPPGAARGAAGRQLHAIVGSRGSSSGRHCACRSRLPGPTRTTVLFRGRNLHGHHGQDLPLPPGGRSPVPARPVHRTVGVLRTDRRLARVLVFVRPAPGRHLSGPDRGVLERCAGLVHGDRDRDVRDDGRLPRVGAIPAWRRQWLASRRPRPTDRSGSMRARRNRDGDIDARSSVHGVLHSRRSPIASVNRRSRPSAPLAARPRPPRGSSAADSTARPTPSHERGTTSLRAKQRREGRNLPKSRAVVI